jgi:deoxyribodipyrimidine photo-lyase
MPRVLHWFRNDLRVHDNPSLYAGSLNAEGELITCYIITPEQWLAHGEAPVKLDLIRRQLADLQSTLTERGIPLIVLRGTNFASQQDIITRFMQQTACSSLFFNEEYGVNERQRDKDITTHLLGVGLKVNRYRDQSILPAGSVLTNENKPYTVFSPFKRRWQASLTEDHKRLLPLPRQQPLPDLGTAELTDWRSVNLKDSGWLAGENVAHKKLQTFASEIAGNYDRHRDLPALDGTSQLSPYLAIGGLSGRQCLITALNAMQQCVTAKAGLDCWINELIWRDFYIHILYHFPRVSMHKAFRPETDALPWNGEGEHYRAWCQGQTGIPIIDAGMRQLNQTGWMHNRLRMICAMFLAKNLFVDWRLGERYFMQHLVDGYLPANNGGWQWSASTGTDAAPYFRIFNPVSQSEKFDPQADFLRRYIPEIAKRDNKTIHQPLARPLSGIDYPTAIVDLKATRQAAIDAFRTLKTAATDGAL